MIAASRAGRTSYSTARSRFNRLTPILENVIYRIVQEGLTNAFRHSQSEMVRVTLRQRDKRVRIEIRDWGVGFDPKDGAREPLWAGRHSRTGALAGRQVPDP